jgi:hypothetical protein
LDFSQKIILFSVKSFDLEQLIASALKKKGFEVIYLDERPSNRKWMKALIRFCPKFVRFYINKYYLKILKSEVCDDADYVLVLRAEVVPVWFLKKIKERKPNLKMIYYGSDSFRNNPAAIEKLQFFDKKYTFDPNDAEQYAIEHLPLFYEDEYLKASKKKYLERDYDVSFIGTVHSDRSKLVFQMVEQLKCKKIFIYLFHHGYGWLKIQRLLGMVKVEKSIQDKIHYSSLSKDQIREIYCNSKIIIDTHHPKQVGLTMRTFEAIGAGAKLITTNETVKQYDFYNAKNICVIDRDHPIIPEIFLKQEAQNLEISIKEKYALSSWLNVVLN